MGSNYFLMNFEVLYTLRLVPSHGSKSLALSCLRCLTPFQTKVLMHYAAHSSVSTKAV